MTFLNLHNVPFGDSNEFEGFFLPSVKAVPPRALELWTNPTVKALAYVHDRSLSSRFASGKPHFSMIFGLSLSEVNRMTVTRCAATFSYSRMTIRYLVLMDEVLEASGQAGS